MTPSEAVYCVKNVDAEPMKKKKVVVWTCVITCTELIHGKGKTHSRKRSPSFSYSPVRLKWKVQWSW